MARFEEVDVERINVVGRDGHPRLVITNEERVPPPVLGGRELKREGLPAPGIFFYNHKGDECGGLGAWSGAAGAGFGAGAGLMFDRFGNDQVVGVTYQEANGTRTYGLQAWERPGGAQRVFCGRNQAGDATVDLCDGSGRPRLRLKVAEDGAAAIEFLGEDGRVVNRLAPGG